MFTIAPHSCSNVMKSVSLCMSGQLFQVWLSAIQTNHVWDCLHLLIINRFVPGLQKFSLDEDKMSLLDERQRYPFNV